MNIIVISCSLHPHSASWVLAQQAVSDLKDLGVEAALYDLRDLTLDFADATTAHKTPDAEMIINAIHEASAVLMAVPIYNYDVNSAAKNLLEIGLRAWNEKLVGFMCAAGGRSSYMSVMSVANSLMLDFRCLIVPRFVYATKTDFGDFREDSMYIASDMIKDRLRELSETTIRLAKALEA